jgi:hypothetical protein
LIRFTLDRHRNTSGLSLQTLVGHFEGVILWPGQQEDRPIAWAAVTLIALTGVSILVLSRSNLD